MKGPCGVSATDTRAAVVRTLHEKWAGPGVLLSLVGVEMDGKRMYGVARNGTVEFAGTKAEARERYGTWRRPL